MKKLVSLSLTLILVLSMLAGCGTAKDTSPTAVVDTSKAETQAQIEERAETALAEEPGEIVLEPMKIAVAFWQIDANSLIIQKYLKEYVGPAFNTEFMFSEAVSDADSLMSFMENAYAAGCHGIINYQNSSVDQAIAKANELGMYIVTNTSINVENNEPPYNLGYVAASVESCAEDFSTLVHELVDDGEKHNVVIVSAGAGLGNDEHYATTVSILKTLQDIYGLTYEESIEELAATRAEIDCANDAGIKITIYPGYPSDTYVPGLSTLLQTGDYDIVLACNAAYAQASVAIDEVEKAFGFNVRVAASTQVTDQTKTSFNTIDSTGNTSLNSALLMPSVSTAGTMFAIMYNGVSGHAEIMRKDGQGIFFNSPKWLCSNAGEYERIEKLNQSDDTYEKSIDELKEMICVFNPDANADSIAEQLDGNTAEKVLGARGL